MDNDGRADNPQATNWPYFADDEPWGPLPPPAAVREWTSPRRIRFVRHLTATYFDFLADWLTAGEITEGYARSEAALALQGLAKRLGGMSLEELTAAHKAEWIRSSEAAQKRLAAIQQAVRPLIWREAPEDRLMAAARDAIHACGGSFADDMLRAVIIDVARPILRSLDKRGRRK